MYNINATCIFQKINWKPGSEPLQPTVSLCPSSRQSVNKHYPAQIMLLFRPLYKSFNKSVHLTRTTNRNEKYSARTNVCLHNIDYYYVWTIPSTCFIKVFIGNTLTVHCFSSEKSPTPMANTWSTFSRQAFRYGTRPSEVWKCLMRSKPFLLFSMLCWQRTKKNFLQWIYNEPGKIYHVTIRVHNRSNELAQSVEVATSSQKSQPHGVNNEDPLHKRKKATHYPPLSVTTV